MFTTFTVKYFSFLEAEPSLEGQGPPTKRFRLQHTPLGKLIYILQFIFIMIAGYCILLLSIVFYAYYGIKINAIIEVPSPSVKPNVNC